jgi:hypothetical protein
MELKNKKSRGDGNTNGPISKNQHLNSADYQESCQDIFEKARSSINKHTIEKLFPGGRWKGKEYHILSPLRHDENIGSFSINEKGLYYDFASNDRGDLIDLVTKTCNVPKIEAAQIIISTSEKGIAYHPLISTGDTPICYKREAIIPIPEEAICKLKPIGAAGIWIYRNQRNEAWCAVARFNKSKRASILLPISTMGKYGERKSD